MKKEFSKEYICIGLNIAYYRKLAGLTQEQLAEETGLTPAYIGHIEAPGIIKVPSIYTLLKISNALEIPIERLFRMD